MDLVRPGANRL